MPQRSFYASFPKNQFPTWSLKELFISDAAHEPSSLTPNENYVRFFIGAPLYRTKWELQNIAVSFELNIVSYLAQEENRKFNIEVLAGNTPVAVNIINFKVAKAKEIIKEKEVTPSETLIEEKQYILELFSPVTLSKSEPLEIAFFMKLQKFPELELNGRTVQFRFKKGMIQFNVNQEQVRRAS